MATLSTTAPTLVEVAKRLNPEGQIDKIVEILSLTNDIIKDMRWVEGNSTVGHRTTVRSGLPTATWRLLNYGVQPTKSQTVQITDTYGMLETYAEIDKSLADINGNSADWMLSENKAFIEGMNQQFASTLIYGSTIVNPERFTGLAPRFNSLSANNGENILSGGGSGNTNTSIWLCGWGENTLHGIYPKGQIGGLQFENKGQHTLYDNNTPPGRYEGYRTHYKWDCGLTLRDWRYVVRIANVDVTALTKNAATGADLIDLMAQACEQIWSLQGCTPVFYVSRKVKSFLRRQIANKVSQSTLTMEMVGGEEVMTFAGVPVRRVDAILNTEATVS